MPETKEQKKIRMQKYYLKNKDKILERCRDYRKTHKDTRYKDNPVRKEWQREYTAKHGEKYNARKKMDRKLNPEKYKEISKKNYLKNKDKILARGKKYRSENIEKYKVYIKKWNSENKEHLSEYKKRRVEQFPELIKKQKKESYWRNRDKILKKFNKNKDEIYRKNKERFLENPEKFRAQRAAFQRKFRQIPSRKFAMSQQGRIRIALKSQNVKKRNKTIELIGCSFSDLRKHLESLFWPGMNWENHGRYGWHVDHIIPIAKFDLSDSYQQKICFNFTNMQPLWWRDNISKGKK
jgi:hypothetical protein